MKFQVFQPEVVSELGSVLDLGCDYAQATFLTHRPELIALTLWLVLIGSFSPGLTMRLPAC